MANKTDKNGQESDAFNPLAWGILFFSLWLSLQPFGELSLFQQGIGGFFLFLSAVMFCSIFMKCLRDFLNKPSLISFLLPVIFFASLMGFAFSLVQSWTNLEGTSLYISIIGGALWLIAYFLILIRIVAELGKIGFWMGTVIGIALIGKGIYDAFTSDVVAGIILIALGIGTIVIVVKKPPIWHKFPFF